MHPTLRTEGKRRALKRQTNLFEAAKVRRATKPNQEDQKR